MAIRTSFTAGEVLAAADLTDTFGAKSSVVLVTNARVANYTLVLGDNGKLVEMAVGSANTLTIPTNASVAFPVGAAILIAQTGAGQTTVGGAGVTINSSNGLKLFGQWSSALLVKRATDTWLLSGDTTT